MLEHRHPCPRSAPVESASVSLLPVRCRMDPGVNALELLREASNSLFYLRGEEGEVTFLQLFDDMPTDAVAELYLSAEEWRKTAAHLSQIIHARLATDLSDGKAIETGGMLLWYGEKPGYETCVDTSGFFAWLEGEPFTMVERVFNPNTARKGALPEAVRSTFFEQPRSGKVEVQAVPVEVLQDARRKKELKGSASG